MIRTLVVDDDFRVARLHAASVERVDGFNCVGEAHDAAQAWKAISELRPDLLLLDIYLPDLDGLSLLRTLDADDRAAPDCIIITAARDLDTVRSAIRSGALYYLVKPFGFAQLRDQLEAYRRWRDELGSAGGAGSADQATVDQLYRALRSGAPAPDPHRDLPPTMRRILGEVTAADGPLSAADVASRLGLSRPTGQRYLSELERRGLVELTFEYGSTGRPVHRYRRPAGDDPPL